MDSVRDGPIPMMSSAGDMAMRLMALTFGMTSPCADLTRRHIVSCYGYRILGKERDMIDFGGVAAVGALTDCDTGDPPDELAARFHIHSAPLLRLVRIDVGHPFPDFGDTQTQRGGGGLL